jgi:hypothetical protein
MSYFDGPSGPSTNYAKIETRVAYIADSKFAMSLCESYLGLNREIVEGLVGRYLRGKRKGLLRGFIEYSFCTHGGWVTGKGLVGRGILSLSLCTSNGWDARRQRSVYSELISWARSR